MPVISARDLYPRYIHDRAEPRILVDCCVASPEVDRFTSMRLGRRAILIYAWSDLFVGTGMEEFHTLL
jgi:hypothetical protein